MTTLVISGYLEKRLTALAESAGIPAEIYALQLLDRYLRDQEDYWIAREESEKLETMENTLSYEEVLRALNLG